MSEEEPTITIDDVDYEWSSLPDEVKHIVNQLNHCRSEVDRLVLETQRAEMMQRGYTAALKDQMEKMNNS